MKQLPTEFVLHLRFVALRPALTDAVLCDVYDLAAEAQPDQPCRQLLSKFNLGTLRWQATFDTAWLWTEKSFQHTTATLEPRCQRVPSWRQRLGSVKFAEETIPQSLVLSLAHAQGSFPRSITFNHCPCPDSPRQSLYVSSCQKLYFRHLPAQNHYCVATSPWDNRDVLALLPSALHLEDLQKPELVQALLLDWHLADNVALRSPPSPVIVTWRDMSDALSLSGSRINISMLQAPWSVALAEGPLPLGNASRDDGELVTLVSLLGPWLPSLDLPHSYHASGVVATHHVMEAAASTSLEPCLAADIITNHRDASRLELLVGIHPVSALARAFAQLPERLLGMSPLLCKWALRELADSAQDVVLADFVPGEFAFEAHDTPSHFAVPLLEWQRRCLAFMRSVEAGSQQYRFEAVEEQRLDPLPWSLQGFVSGHAVAPGGLIASALGAGKTAAILGLMEASQRSLVIVPPNLLQMWQCEIKKFLGRTFSVGVFGSTACDKDCIVLVPCDILLCPDYRLCWQRCCGDGFLGRPGEDVFAKSYFAALRNLHKSSARPAELLECAGWRRIVVDEVHAALQDTPRAAATRQFLQGLALWTSLSQASVCTWGLTGTPPVNDTGSLVELANILGFFLPGRRMSWRSTETKQQELERLMRRPLSALAAQHVRDILSKWVAAFCQRHGNITLTPLSELRCVAEACPLLGHEQEIISSQSASAGDDPSGIARETILAQCAAAVCRRLGTVLRDMEHAFVVCDAAFFHRFAAIVDKTGKRCMSPDTFCTGLLLMDYDNAIGLNLQNCSQVVLASPPVTQAN